jgi:L-threonylcarbamoyladenylate synthase
MRATVEPVTDTARDAPALHRAAALIRAGELVAFPTETVYGLGANALDPAAVAKIFEAKGRPFADPLIVHLATADDVPLVTGAAPDPLRTSQVARLTRAFWPGPLTLILPRGERVPTLVTAGRDTVAVRVPAHPVAHALLVLSARPIAAPSANRFSRPSPTTAAHVAADLGDRIDLILDGGATTHGVESTVVDMTGDRPVILRPGAITLEALQAVVPEVVMVESASHASADADPTAQRSPGTLLKHYSPTAAVRFWTGDRSDALAAMHRDAERALAAGQRVGALVSDDDAPAFADLPVQVIRLGPAAAPEVGASRLYDALRALDAAGVDVILARDPGTVGLCLTIRDRLYRAAEGRVLDSRNRSDG